MLIKNRFCAATFMGPVLWASVLIAIGILARSRVSLRKPLLGKVQVFHVIIFGLVVSSLVSLVTSPFPLVLTFAGLEPPDPIYSSEYFSIIISSWTITLSIFSLCALLVGLYCIWQRNVSCYRWVEVLEEKLRMFVIYLLF